MSIIKKRNWAFVLYPESAPQNWREILQLTGLQCAISPLHDKDINPDNEPKKAHYHVIVGYDGPTSYNVVKSLTDRLNCPIPQPLEQVRGYYRYLTHKDNPEKAQYDEKDITTINGFDISNYVEMTKSEIDKYKIEILSFIQDNDINEYADLLDLLKSSELLNHLIVASNHTLLFHTYISSRRNKAKTELYKSMLNNKSSTSYNIYYVKFYFTIHIKVLFFLTLSFIIFFLFINIVISFNFINY